MENKLEKKYGLMTAIAMVVGIVIGSGIFFKAVKVMSLTENLGQSLLVVGLVGVIMIICSIVFATLGSKYSKVNGIVDYAEVALGPKFGYYVGWFMTTIYYPVLASCLAWVAARYTCALFQIEQCGEVNVAIAALYLCLGFTINGLAPKLAGKLQISMTIIKLIPLVVMAVVGTIAGLINGMTVEAFTEVGTSMATGSSGGVFAGVTAFAFAYEGWIIATTINSELKDAKKNLPIALILGAIICVGVYMLYFVGLSGALSWNEIIASGDNLPRVAFSSLFGSAAGTIVFVFIVISCLGTMNGLILGCSRGMYSLAARGAGPKQELFAEVSPKSNMVANSTLIGLALSGFWLFYWQVCFVDGFINNTVGLGWSPVSLNIPLWFNWEPDEVSIIALYAFYIPIFISVMKNMKDLGWVKRFLLPALAVLSCVFMIYCTIIAYGIQCLYFTIFLLIVLFIGFLFRKGVTKNKKQENILSEVHTN